MKLTRISKVGRFRMPDGRAVNVFRGRASNGGVYTFWLRQNSKQLITDGELAHWELIEFAPTIGGPRLFD